MKTVISVVNPKGGVSKSTITINLAYAAWDEGDDVTIIDTDPQGTVLDWHNARPDDLGGPAVVHENDPDRLSSVVEDVRSPIVFIDTPAQLQRKTGEVLELSTLCLTPLEPSPADIWGTEEFRSTLEQKASEGLKVALVAARRDPRTKLGGELFDLADDYPFEFCDGICQRVAYKRTMAKGRTVLEGNDAKAKNEVRELLIEVAQLLKQ